LGRFFRTSSSRFSSQDRSTSRNYVDYHIPVTLAGILQSKGSGEGEADHDGLDPQPVQVCFQARTQSTPQARGGRNAWNSSCLSGRCSNPAPFLTNAPLDFFRLAHPFLLAQKIFSKLHLMQAYGRNQRLTLFSAIHRRRKLSGLWWQPLGTDPPIGLNLCASLGEGSKARGRLAGGVHFRLQTLKRPHPPDRAPNAYAYCSEGLV
jgi:hypothetical protein